MGSKGSTSILPPDPHTRHPAVPDHQTIGGQPCREDDLRHLSDELSSGTVDGSDRPTHVASWDQYTTTVHQLHGAGQGPEDPHHGQFSTDQNTLGNQDRLEEWEG